MRKIKYGILSLTVVLLFVLQGYFVDEIQRRFNVANQNHQYQASLLWYEDWELPQQDYRRWRIGYNSSSSECTTSGYSSDTHVSGNYSHRSEISCKSDQSHRGYGVLTFDGDHSLLSGEKPSSKAGLKGIDAPYGIVNTYWSWLDTPHSFSPQKWFSFWTTTGTCKTWNPVITLALRNPTRKLESFHIVKTGGIVKYDENASAFPLRQWVRTTIYINYNDKVMHVWQDGKHLLEANFTRKSNKICHFHWGAYADQENDTLVLYEDDLSIWKLQQPWQDFDREPLFEIPST